MPYEFSFSRRVEFADTDTAGVAHFSAFLRYMEEAEHAFYRSMGSVAYDWSSDGVRGMPRVSAHCEYLEPLHYGDEFEVGLTVCEKTSKAIGYEVVFRRREGEEQGERGERREIARGTMKVVYATRAHGSQEWTAAPLPPELSEQIEVAPASE